MITNYIPRAITDSILESAEYFPVTTLTGPRQSGKSTLLRHTFPNTPYISLEEPDIRLAAVEDPRGFIGKYDSGVIIDEIQHVPELLSYIQSVVDLHPERKFYITGSSQFSLLRSVTQSLAGRTSVFELLPLSLQELGQRSDPDNVDQLLHKGFYPAVWSGRNRPELLYRSYVRTYLERDVRDLLAIKNLDTFQRFTRLCAARIGSVFNASELSNELGVAVGTINSWLSVLKASYIIFTLPPFFTNTRKRLTKSPKIYFTDCGLAASLLEIETPEAMNLDKMRGHLFENMVIMNFLKTRYNKGLDGGIYYYRDSNGNEVDLLIKSGSGYRCCEIKSSATFHPDFIKGLKNFQSSFPDLFISGEVIYSGETMPDFNGMKVLNFRQV